MRGDRGRADVEGDAVGALDEAGPDRDDVAALAQRDRDLPAARAQRLLQAARARRKLGVRVRDAPLRVERLLQAAEVAGGIVHVGFGDLDIVQAHDRIDVDRMRLGALAHDLAMNLAFRRHVDDEIAADLAPGSRAAAPRAKGPRLSSIALLDLVPRRDVIGARRDRVLGELALGDLDLAAPANAAPAADRIEIDAELARGVEQAVPSAKLASLARRA